MDSSELWRNRWIRYGAPVALIVVSVLVAAADTGHVGNDVQVAGTALGLLWLIGMIGHDMGMGTSSGRRRHVPDPPPDAAEASSAPRPPDAPSS